MEEIKKDRKKITKVLSLIILIILIIALATYAWFTWNSPENTKLSMDIGEAAEVMFIDGNDISTNELAPVLTYSDGKKTEFMIENQFEYDYQATITVNITSIASELQDESVRYVVEKSNDNSNFSKVKEGSFKDLKVGSNDIAFVVLPTLSTTYYKFYIYIDGSVENNTNMMGKAIVGSLSVSAKTRANSPDLVDGLIPVIYNGTNWVVTNEDSEEVTVNYKLGDTNRDGELDPSDIMKTGATVNGYMGDFDSYVLHAGDVDGDGKLTQNDAALIQKCWLDKITTFPAGDPLQEGTYKTDAYKWYDYGNKRWANSVLVSNSSTTIYDMSGNSKNGTISGATYTSEGLSFDGTDDYISLPSKIGATLPATYSITFKTNSTSNQILFGDYSTSAGVGLFSNNTKLIVSLHATNTTYTFATGGIDIGTYYTIDIVYNSLSSISVYLNGTKLTQNEDTNYWTWPDTNSYIGKRSSGTNFNGTIKNFAVYDDVLTESEIKYNLTANKHKVCGSGIICDDLALYYDFTGTTRDNYLGAKPGTVIDDSNILAHYVWIPRYKYKVWNITKTIGASTATDSYGAYNKGIDILFENETKKTGTIDCTITPYSFVSPTSATTPNETCVGSNGKYYTHPAFWWDSNGNNVREESEEVRGIWVGKFELSTPSSSTCYSSLTNCTDTTLSVRIKPNAKSWRSNYLTNFNYVIQNMQADSNEYGLTTDRTKADSHMLKNMEWGAVAYLTHSEYGRCTNGECEEVSNNSYSVYKTGCGPQSLESPTIGGGGVCNEYNTELGQLASTTGNVYGIYDMSGGADEYLMANISSASGSYTYNAKSDSGVGYTYDATTVKYMDTYAHYTSSVTQQGYNLARLGDATGEVVLSRQSQNGWYSDYTFFPNAGVPWFRRGGDYSLGIDVGVFSFRRGDGSTNNNISARACLVGKS